MFYDLVEYVSWHSVSDVFLFVYLSHRNISDICLHTAKYTWVLKGLTACWAEDINPVTVMHLISRDNKLKTLTRETPLFNKLALFSGRKWGILHTKQSIKVNDPAIHTSVTAEHCCINYLTSQLVKLRSSLRSHSVPDLSWGWEPEVLVLDLALINKFCSNGKNNRRC